MTRDGFIIAARYLKWLGFTVLLYGSTAVADTSLPIISHDVAIDEVPAGTRVLIDALVTDDGPINEVRLNFRLPEQTQFTVKPMQFVESNKYQAVLEADEVIQPSVDYFITAQDAAGNLQSRGFAFDPLRLQVGPPEIVANSTNDDSGNVLQTKSTNKIWYVIGAVAVAGLIASQAGSEDTTPNGCPCLELEL